MVWRFSGWMAIVAVLASCTIAPKVELVTGQTALERQLLGKAAELDEKALLVAPFRDAATTEAATDSTYRRAVMGRAFRQDEIQQWVKKGWLREGEDGLLHRGNKVPSPTIKKRFNRLFTEENADRQQIIQWIIRYNPDFHDSDAAKLGQLFYQLRQRPR